MAYAESETSRDRRAQRVLAAQGAVLRRHREQAARSITDVAAVAQCSPAHLSEVERGRKDVSTQRLVAISAALGIPVHLLFADIADELSPATAVDARGLQHDPKVQLERAAALLTTDGLRAVAAFSSYLAGATPATRRRIGFVVSQQEEQR